MAFKDIKGQDRAIEFFSSSVNKQRLAHAYLFLGPKGLGKTLLAKNLAKFLNCENPIKDEALFVDCCDACISCRKIDDSNHPDVRWIESGRSKKISIDAIRLAQKGISLKSYEGKFKVLIILQADEMTGEAANSLLKTLEEPSANSLIILTCDSSDGLLPTIISRCQIIRFYPLSLERLKEILTSDYKIKSDEVHSFSAQAEGSIGRALNLKDQDSLGKKNRLIKQVCQSGPGLSASNIFSVKDKKELANQIRHLLDWFRDILILKVGMPTSSIINADRIEKIKSQAQGLAVEDLEQVIAKIDQAHRLIEKNINPKIALEVMLAEIKRCKRLF